MLTLITAQHFESLQTVLLAQLMQPDDDPLRPQPVLVPSTALRRALSLAVADTHGVCAQVEFSFLAQWLWAQMAVVVPGIPADSPFDPDCLRWRLLRLLEADGLTQAHPRLRAYLQDADVVMRFDLAGQLASLFDQYITYRQHWLAAWAAGRLVATPASDLQARADEAWQADLWRALLADLQAPGASVPGSHPVQRFLDRLAAAHRTGTAVPGLPGVVHVFCVPTISPLYLQVLEGLAQHLEVILYVLDPCREYWYDTVSERYLAQRVQRGEDGAYAVGHRLLSAWGRQTQSFLQLLLSREAPRKEFSLPGRGAVSTSLLGAVQADIIALRDLQPGSLHRRAHADGTLQVQVCHGLMRELEVLHDHLLRSFIDDPSLTPAQVLVVVPDLETAAPLIEAVFGQEGGAPGSARRALPFAITGLAPAASSPLAQALLAILDFARSRMPLSGLLELLHHPLVARGLGLIDEDVSTLAAQLRAAHVHWALDPQHLDALQLPAAGGHTLQEGLTRLLLGHALPDDHAGVWAGALAAGNVEGSDALLLGVLHACVARLAQLRAALQGSLLPEHWLRLLEQVLQDWLPVQAGEAGQLTALRADLQAQQAELQAAALCAPLPAEVLLRALQERLQGHASGGVATGAITFAALPSLRMLPFRQVCVLGLDDGVFPSARRPLDFDLLSAYPSLGDRQRSEDERNLFLDLLLAARERLYLSYSGRSARDDSVRPPSVLLAELLDALVPALCAADAAPDVLQHQRAALVTAHALQPFDARYFRKASADPAAGLPQSFQEVYAAALRQRARTLAGGDLPVAPTVLAGAPAADGWPPALPARLADAAAAAELPSEREDDEDSAAASNEPAFFTVALPAPEAAWRQVRLEQLIAFLQHPARYLLRRRLGLALPARADLWEDAEDFLPEFNAAEALARRLLPDLLAGLPAERLRAVAAAGPEFPAGALGEAARSAALWQLQGFADRVREALAVPAQPARSGSLAFLVDDEAWTLSGTSGPLHAAQLAWRFHAPWPGDELEAWVRHLWLCALAGQAGQPPAVPTLWLFSTTRLRFAPLAPEVARGHLQRLMACYRHGLQQPLHFYPKSARALVAQQSLAQAVQKWAGRPPAIAGERDDPAWSLALRGVAEPLGSDFEALAEQVWGPLLSHAVVTALAEPAA